MADNAILFKYLVKSVGMKHSILPSFMAKPWGNVCPFQPQWVIGTLNSRDSFQGAAGTLPHHWIYGQFLITHSHVHVSLRSKDGRNIFAVPDADLNEGRADAAFEDTKWLSKEGEWFLAGVLDGLADVVPLVRGSSGRQSLILTGPARVVCPYDQRIQALSRGRGALAHKRDRPVRRALTSGRRPPVVLGTKRRDVGLRLARGLRARHQPAVVPAVRDPPGDPRPRRGHEPVLCARGRLPAWPPRCPQRAHPHAAARRGDARAGGKGRQQRRREACTEPGGGHEAVWETRECCA